MAAVELAAVAELAVVVAVELAAVVELAVVAAVVT